MTTRVRRSLIALAVLAAAVYFALPQRVSLAGYWEQEECDCAENADGSGSCYGTLQCFRNSPDDNADAQFDAMYNQSGQLVDFIAHNSKSSFFCTVTDPERAKVALMTIAGMGPKDGFWVTWDGKNNCRTIEVYHSSERL